VDPALPVLLHRRLSSTLIAPLHAKIAEANPAYNLLTENDWRSADVKAIVERTLAPFAGGRRIAMNGPEIQISAKLTLPEGLSCKMVIAGGRD
jgi:hypothetical protein